MDSTLSNSIMSSSPCESVDFLDRLQLGDQDAEREFVRFFSGKCFSFARRAGVGYPDYEDLTSECISSALLQIRAGQFRRQASLNDWFFCIARRRIARHWRTRFRGLNPLSLDDLVVRKTAIVSVASVEAALVFTQALRHLSRKQVKLFLLNVVYGYSTSEIGVLTQRSPGRVGAILADAKRTMRSALSEPRADEEPLSGQVLGR